MIRARNNSTTWIEHQEVPIAAVIPSVDSEGHKQINIRDKGLKIHLRGNNRNKPIKTSETKASEKSSNHHMRTNLNSKDEEKHFIEITKGTTMSSTVMIVMASTTLEIQINTSGENLKVQTEVRMNPETSKNLSGKCRKNSTEWKKKLGRDTKNSSIQIDSKVEVVIMIHSILHSKTGTQSKE